jgi:hypothetical protein
MLLEPAASMALMDGWTDRHRPDRQTDWIPQNRGTTGCQGDGQGLHFGGGPPHLGHLLHYVGDGVEVQVAAGDTLLQEALQHVAALALRTRVQHHHAEPPALLCTPHSRRPIASANEGESAPLRRVTRGRAPHCVG